MKVSDSWFHIIQQIGMCNIGKLHFYKAGT